MAAPTAPRARAPLDLLRFSAAAFVVLFHYKANAPISLNEVSPVLARGWLATDFFILLSGFVLGRAYGAKLDAGRIAPAPFFTRRALRVWPGHLMVLAGFACMVAAAAAIGFAPPHPENYTSAEFWRQAALVHGWSRGALDGWNGPTWTLSALIVCYALFPLVWRASRRCEARLAALGVALLVVAVSALACAALLGARLYDLDWGVVRALPLFTAGALLARFAPALQLSGGRAALIVSASAAVFGLAQAAPPSPLADLTTIAAIGGVILGADAWRGRSAWAAYAGELSFALFLTHTLTGAVWFGAS
ncbi:MAG TPA: acyltransferase, partial [Caulobacteraceae bacterium]